MVQLAGHFAEARFTFKPMLICLGAAFALAGCATVEEAPANDWTEADEIAYQQCLNDRMAEAVAWEMIERSCRAEVEGDDDAPALD